MKPNGWAIVRCDGNARACDGVAYCRNVNLDVKPSAVWGDCDRHTRQSLVLCFMFDRRGVGVSYATPLYNSVCCLKLCVPLYRLPVFTHRGTRQTSGTAFIRIYF